MARLSDITGREVLLKASGVKAGRILDVGIGECACMAFFLARQGFDVTGIDISSQAIHVARQDAQTKRLKGAFVARRADAQDMPFDNGAFDVVISFHSLHHIDRPVRAVREMFRVCRPGGTVLVAELNATGRKIYDHEASDNGLLRMIERVGRSMSSDVRIAHTRMDRLFVFVRKRVPEQRVASRARSEGRHRRTT